MKTDFGGLPIAFHLTGGEASDSRNFETLLDIGPDLNPRAALGDKGYDSKSNRDAARQRGICPAIPYRSNTKDMPAFFPKTLYKARARIEQAVGKLKRFKRIALRCEKTAQNYGSFVALALGFILIKSELMNEWPLRWRPGFPLPVSSLPTLPRWRRSGCLWRAPPAVRANGTEGTRTVAAQVPRSYLVRSWSPTVPETFDA